MSFADILKVEGINHKGFGTIAKSAMLDDSLSLEAKAIYAYFCSFAGAGQSSFPSRNRILSDLNMSKNTYYLHFNKLVENDYIHVKQSVSGNLKSRNIYTLVSNPEKFKNKTIDFECENERIMQAGLKSAGYGTIPKAVMQDDRLPVKAKGIYAYFCSLTGNGGCAFPKKNVITYHLGISEKTYYKFFKILVRLNYITVVQRRADGHFGINDYYLNDNPDESMVNLSHEINQQDGKICDTDKTIENPTTSTDVNDKRRTVKYGTVKNGTVKNGTPEIETHKINSIKINNIKINRSINLSNDGWIEDENLFLNLFSDYAENDNKTSDENDPEQAIENIVHSLTNYDRAKSIIKDPFTLSSFKLFNNALVAMLSSNHGIIISGRHITPRQVINTISDSIYEESGKLFFKDDWNTVAMNNFKNACRQQTIRNHMAYMQSCIWNAIQEGDISVMAAIEMDFGN